MNISDVQTLKDASHFLTALNVQSKDLSVDMDSHEFQYKLGNYLSSLKDALDKKDTKVAETAEDVLKEIKEIRKQSQAKKKAKKKGVTVTSEPDKVDHDYLSLGHEWMVQAAELGNVNALCSLGNNYLARVNAADCSYDDKLALIKQCIDQYERAAALNSTDALYNLGSLYYSGSEIGNTDMFVDYKRSYEYFMKSAELGDVSATFWIGYCHYSGGPAIATDNMGNDILAYDIDMDKALDYFRTASRLQHDQADYYVARLHYDRSYGRVADGVNLLSMDDVLTVNSGSNEPFSNSVLMFYYSLARSVFLYHDPLAVHFLSNLCHERYFVHNVHLVEEKLSLEDRVLLALVDKYIERCTVTRDVGADGEEIATFSPDETLSRLTELNISLPETSGGDMLSLSFHLTSKDRLLSASPAQASESTESERDMWIKSCHKLRSGTMVLLESVANSCSDAALNLGK